MANVLVDETSLTNIATAIRNKNKTTKTYKPSEMATAISEITTNEDLTSELTEQNNLINTQEATIEDIVLALQNKSSGGEITLQEKTVTPTINQQEVVPDSEYNGLSKVIVNAVTSSIDSNIQASNIKNGISILGVTGTLEEGITPTGTLELTENGTYDVRNYASALVNVASSGGSSNVASGTFTPTENYASADQYFEFDLGFQPSAVVVFRKTWAKGTQSINVAFRSSSINFSVCNTASSSKAVEKLVASSYITISTTGFKITGNTSYYLVGGVEYVYVAVP